ncbi:MAG: ankyrin repeat domain-containing protein [Planctomycetota bacterium]
MTVSDPAVLFTSAPPDRLAAALDAQPRLANTFLSRSAAHGEEQWMPLHFAAHAGYVAAVDLLLTRGVHPDCRTRFTTPMHARQTPLHLAAAAGHTATVARLLDARAETDLRDAYQRTPLWLAARHRHPDVIRALLARHADPDAADAQRRTPLHAALLPDSSFDPTPALLLLDAGADPNAPCPADPAGYTPLHRCVTLGDPALPVAQALLAADADPNLADPRHDRTPRRFAEHLNQIAYVSLFTA